VSTVDPSMSATQPSQNPTPARLSYWSGQGLAEIVRLMLAATGEPWEERVYGSGARTLSEPAQLERMIADGVLAFDQVPLLEIDGLYLVQKLAIVRYLARKHGMYGADLREAAQLDILSDGLSDWATRLRDDPEAANAKYLPRLARALASSNGAWFVADAPSFVDVQFLATADAAVRLDPNALAEHPRLAGHRERVAALPGIAAYLASDRRYPFPGLDGYYDRVRAVIPWTYGDAPPPAIACPRWRFCDDAS
jgi:glutathione S-transferase